MQKKLDRRRFLLGLSGFGIEKIVGQSHKEVIHVVKRGETISELKEFYGDPRDIKRIYGNGDFRNIAPGTEVVFLADNEKFRRHGLSPDGSENWGTINSMGGPDFFKFIDEFGYRKHIRLIPELSVGNFEKNQENQMENLSRLSDFISYFSNIYGVDPLYHAAIGLHESGLRAMTVSPTGPLGAWQISRATASRNDFGGEINPYNEIQAAERSAAYLGFLERRFSKIHPDLPIIGYEIGEGAIGEVAKTYEGNALLDYISENPYLKKVNLQKTKILQNFGLKNGIFERIT
ncbi:transglycosylase SLT domain-containing protein [Candidatus Pacearchaeota archaeon]|nr:transglycosylase SLT domain-containing protein [Candidatus Pacearchaeota archaeon]